jgi:sarcosine oxidase
MTRPFDVIVVGVGAMGSAACWQLARRGVRVLGLERYDIPHAYGSSHGLTRIIRLAYFESAAYVPLLQRAFELWREAGDAFGEQLLVVTGGVDASAADGRIFRGSLDSCIACGLPHETMSGAEVNRRFPGYGIPATHMAVYQPDAGFVLSERAIVAHVAMAQAAGAEIHAREAVREWSPIAGGGVRVETDRGSYEAGRLILSPGAWISDFVPALKTLAVPERQVLGWFQPSAPAKFTPDSFPVAILDVPEGLFYLLPSHGIPGLKLGLYGHFHERGHADTLSRTPTATDEAALRSCLAAHFPEANGPTMALATCMFTMTPDEHFIIDRLPGNDDVVIASPCSGHGYKFASTVGEILADLAISGKSRFDLGMFSLARLMH